MSAATSASHSVTAVITNKKSNKLEKKSVKKKEISGPHQSS